MRAELYPIVDCPVGRLAIMPRPRAGDWLEDARRLALLDTPQQRIWVAEWLADAGRGHRSDPHR